MLNELWNWWQFNFAWGLACLGIGLLAVSPFLLSRSFRKRLARSDYGIEHLEFIGLVVIVVGIVAIGIYNYSHG